MIECTEKIPEPILISKTQKTSTFICPIVKIKNSELKLNADKAKITIVSINKELIAKEDIKCDLVNDKKI